MSVYVDDVEVGTVEIPQAPWVQIAMVALIVTIVVLIPMLVLLRGR